MYMGIGQNDHGTPISQHICDTCNKTFTVCWGDAAPDEVFPASAPEGLSYPDCTRPECPSYDPARDIDKVWEGVQKFVERTPVPQPEEG